MTIVSQQDKPEDGLVLVGEITASFGVRGQVKMRPLMSKPEALAKLPSVLLRYPDGREERKKATSVRVHQGQGVVIVTFPDVTDRNAADLMREALMLVARDELPPLPEGEYYQHDLLGLHVTTEAGRDLGTVQEVHFYPANDVLETEVAMIPAVEGEIVIKVDLVERRLIVRDIPGLHKDE